MLSEFVEGTTNEEKSTFDSTNSKLKALEFFIDDSIAEELSYDDEDKPFIENRNQAEYFITQYKKALQTVEENETAYKNYIEQQTQKADLWLNQANQEPKFIIEQIGLILEDFARKNITSDDKRKSIKLINGTIGLHAQQPEYIYDEEIVRNFLEENDTELLIQQKPKINKTALKKKCTIDGEFLKLNGKEIPSATINFREDNFYVK